MDYKTILMPYLIQRGTFRDIPDQEIAGLDSLMDYDYMGSSEFEWGALPKSLKGMTSNWADYVTFQIDSIKDNNGDFLQVLCRKSQAEDVKDVLIKLFDKDCQIRLKERTGMHDYLACKSTYSLRVNFWWDVTGSDYLENRGMSNDWMCCFGNNIRRLIIAVRKVWSKHNESEVSPTFGPQVPNNINKPSPSELLIDKDRDYIRVTTTAGIKTTINTRAIQDVIIHPDKLEVIVKIKSGAIRTLYIMSEPTNHRKVLENMLNEQKEYSKTLK